MYGLFSIPDNHIIDHGYGSEHGAIHAKTLYANSHNIHLFQYNNGVLVSKFYQNVIQKELTNRNIK